MQLASLKRDSGVTLSVPQAAWYCAVSPPRPQLLSGSPSAAAARHGRPLPSRAAPGVLKCLPRGVFPAPVGSIACPRFQ